MFEERIKAYMEQYRRELVEQCEAGMRGETRIGVNKVTLALTNQCNLHCIMCPAISKKHKYNTYYNALPKMLTLSDVKSLLGKKEINPDIAEKGENANNRVAFDIVSGETFLNPEIFEILRYIKESYPTSEVRIISNGTIPPVRPEIVQFIDILIFSLDGGTKKVFEEIRTPSKFEHVIDTIKEWISARNAYNPGMSFQSCTTLSALNIQDLSNIVRLVGTFNKLCKGGWDTICCQPVIIKSHQDKWLEKTRLDYVDHEIGRAALQESIKVAEEHKIRLAIPESIFQIFEDNLAADVLEKEEENIAYKKFFCKKLSDGGLSYDVDGSIRAVCCFMDMDEACVGKLLADYEIDEPEFSSLSRSIEETYNCKGYWKLRKDLLEGNLQEKCRHCIHGETDYYLALMNLKKIILMDELESVKRESEGVQMPEN